MRKLILTESPENAPAAADGSKLDRSAMIALAAPTAGFILLAIALAVFGSRAAESLSAGAFWSLTALGVAGFALFVFGLLRSRGGREQRFALENATLTQANADLTQRNATLDTANREAQFILDAIPGSVLTIDREYRILVRHTRELDGVLPRSEFDDDNLLSMLRRLLPEAKFDAAHAYLGTIFDSAANAAGAPPHPLWNVEVIATTPNGAKALHTLSFVVRPTVETGPDARALVWIEDTTERLQRERSEREVDATKAKQFDMLIGIVHVAPEALDAFASGVTKHLGSIDETLRAGHVSLRSGQSEAFRERLETILQQVRAIKTSAATLQLRYFETRAADYEAKIAYLKLYDILRGDDFLTLVMEQSAFRSELDGLQALRARLAAPGEDAAERENEATPVATPISEPTPPQQVTNDLGAAVSKLANERARKLGKQVVVNASGLDSQTLSPERRALVKDVLLELTHNALEHGIEDPSVREASGKPRAGAIDITPATMAVPGAFGLTFRDDGRGLDTSTIRDRAVAAGLIDAESAVSIDESQIAGFMFSPALGSGLSTIKRRVVDDCGGSISVDSENGTFSEFSFELPA
jgi:hypothetical protein